MSKQPLFNHITRMQSFQHVAVLSLVLEQGARENIWRGRMVTKSLICLKSESMTLCQRYNIPFRFSQQCPCPGHEPLKGLLSQEGAFEGPPTSPNIASGTTEMQGHCRMCHARCGAC